MKINYFFGLKVLWRWVVIVLIAAFISNLVGSHGSSAYAVLDLIAVYFAACWAEYDTRLKAARVAAATKAE